MNFLRNTANQLITFLGLSSHQASSSNPQDDQQGRNFTHDQASIIQVALLLRSRLPVDLIPLVLDYAHFWTTFATANSLHREPDRIGEPQAPKLQVALVLPQNIRRNCIRRIRFTTISRDQGWSSYHNSYGTYENSWTWFEAGIRGLDRTNHADLDTITHGIPVSCQHRNGMDPEHIAMCQPQASCYKYGPKRIVTNVHAGQDFKKHVVIWNMDHGDEGVRAMMRELKGGCRIEVAALARFPGWCNYVEKVKIEVEGIVVRKM